MNLSCNDFKKLIACNLLMLNRMRDKRLNNNLIVYVKNDIFNKIDNELIIQRF